MAKAIRAETVERALLANVEDGQMLQVSYRGIHSTLHHKRQFRALTPAPMDCRGQCARTCTLPHVLCVVAMISEALDISVISRLRCYCEGPVRMHVTLRGVYESYRTGRAASGCLPRQHAQLAPGWP